MGSEKIWGLKIGGSQKILVQRKILGPKKIVDPKIFFGSTKILAKKNCGKTKKWQSKKKIWVSKKCRLQK